MGDYLSTQLANFNNLQISIDLAEIKTPFLKQVEKYPYPLLIRIAGGLFTIRKEAGDNTLYAFTSIEGEEQLAEKVSPEEIKYRLVRTIFMVLHRSLYLNARVFPTERTTLVTLPFGSRSSGKASRPLDQISCSRSADNNLPANYARLRRNCGKLVLSFLTTVLIEILPLPNFPISSFCTLFVS
jgi:hypothetical protein